MHIYNTHMKLANKFNTKLKWIQSCYIIAMFRLYAQEKNENNKTLLPSVST